MHAVKSRRWSVTLVALIPLAWIGAVACGGDDPAPDPDPVTLGHPDGVITATQLLQNRPYGVAVSGSGIVYVALIGSNMLVRGSLPATTFPDTVLVGNTPPHVAFLPGGQRVFATLQTAMGVAAVDVASNALVTTVPLSSDGFNLAANAQRIYATTAAGQLYVINASTYGVVTTLNVGAAANGLAFSPDGATLYVSSRDAGTITAIRTSDNAITRTYVLGGMLQRIAVSPDGATLYAANETVGLDVLDLASGAADTVGFGTPAYGLGITPDGEQLYVLLSEAGQVRILNRADLAPVRSLVIGGRPRNVAFDSLGTTALVTNEESVTFIE